MAGEKNGKAYEAVLKVALDLLHEENLLPGNVYWNVKPKGLTVEPDFIVGNDIEHPDIIIMVTHSVAFHNSDMKCWRNIGELCEAKTMLKPMPLAINIIFDALIKETLKDIQRAAFDGQLIVGDRPYGPVVTSWIKSHADGMPTDKEAKVQYIKDSLSVDSALKHSVQSLMKELSAIITSAKTKTSKLWEYEKKRKINHAPQAKITHFRHGIIKRLLVGDALVKGAFSAKDGSWLAKLGIAKDSVIRGKYTVVDPDLIWFLDTDWAANYKQIAKLYANKGFYQQIEKVRNIGLVNSYYLFVEENYDELITVSGMKKCLIEQHSNPAYGLSIPTGIKEPQTVWMYEYVGAIVKAATGKSQAFGYGTFISHPDSSSFLVGTIPVGEWCSSFINQYFSRKEAFKVSDEVITYVATVLSSTLSQYPLATIGTLQQKIEGKHIKSEYGNKLLTHNGFAPLVSLLIDKKIIKSKSDVCSIRNCFAEQAGLTGRAGKIFVIHVGNTIIGWKTATEEGRDHKRKELSGKAVGLRYSWNESTQQYEKRQNVSKLILLVDGTWKQKELDALAHAGWDEIYYQDEIDKLKAAIV